MDIEVYCLRGVCHPDLPTGDVFHSFRLFGSCRKSPDSQGTGSRRHLPGQLGSKTNPAKNFIKIRRFVKSDWGCQLPFFVADDLLNDFFTTSIQP